MGRFRKNLVTLIVGTGILFGCQNFLLPEITRPNTTEETEPVDDEDGEENEQDDGIDNPDYENPENPSNPDDPEEPSTPIQRGDVYTTITFQPSYFVGDYFNFTGRIQSNREQSVLIDNTHSSALEYSVIREGEAMKNEPVEEDFYLKLLEGGYVEMKYMNHEVMFKASNVEGEIDGQHMYLPAPLSITVTKNADAYIFEEPGNYWVELSARYTYDGNTYQSKFTSPQFTVSE